MINTRSRLSATAYTVATILEKTLPLLASFQSSDEVDFSNSINIEEFKSKLSVALIQRHEATDLTELEILSFTGILTNTCIKIVNATIIRLSGMPDVIMSVDTILTASALRAAEMVSVALERIDTYPNQNS